MGNGNTTEERHVVFASDAPHDDGYGGSRTTTTTYRQSRSPVRMDIPANDWDERPVGRTRQQTSEWLQYDDVEDGYLAQGQGQGWQQQRRYGTLPYQSSRSSVRVGPNSRVTRTSSYFPQRSLMARSFPSAGYHEERSPSRAFNMRDPDDRWYNYRPEVNQRADWALVGRHVKRPASARTSSAVPSRLFYDNDSATSDPTSDRLRRGAGSMVRRTDNPRVQTTSRSVYWEDDDGDATYGRWPGQSRTTSYNYQRPTNTYSYQTYRR